MLKPFAIFIWITQFEIKQVKREIEKIRNDNISLFIWSNMIERKSKSRKKSQDERFGDRITEIREHI